MEALNTLEDLTELGNHLLDLPVEPQYGKMLLYAINLKCLDPVLTIVSCLSVHQDLFQGTLVFFFSLTIFIENFISLKKNVMFPLQEMTREIFISANHNLLKILTRIIWWILEHFKLGKILVWTILPKCIVLNVIWTMKYWKSLPMFGLWFWDTWELVDLSELKVFREKIEIAMP